MWSSIFEMYAHCHHSFCLKWSKMLMLAVVISFATITLSLERRLPWPLPFITVSLLLPLHFLGGWIHHRHGHTAPGT